MTMLFDNIVCLTKFFTTLFFVSFCQASPTSYPASLDTYFTWLGRTLMSPAGVTFDLEGTTLEFTVVNATYIGLSLLDNTNGGARLGVYLDSTSGSSSISSSSSTSSSSPISTKSFSTADPNPAGRAIPGLRVATLLTSPFQTLYTLGSGGQISDLNSTTNTIFVRVVNLAEYSMIGSRAGGFNLTITAILTDGVLLPSRSQTNRPRFLVLGDSLSSGVGAGFSVASNQFCGAGVAIDDWAQTWNALLCANFSANCEVIAQSGVTIVADTSYNLPMSIPYTLGSMGYSDWPTDERVAWKPAPVDAVFIELGENDAHAFNVTSPTGLAKLSGAYIQLVNSLAKTYGSRIPYFFTLSSHEAGQSSAMLLAIDQLKSEYPKAMLLNGTTGSYDPTCPSTFIANGCAGHPSFAQNVLAFERMQPIVKAALGNGD
jgi:hypothetical protein